ncbi:hypothetical protein TNCV_1649481 [Trichonephila clavipes]|nr:hypothetical protein TNCV_1649481 [Trichonephila clavipes]
MTENDAPESTRARIGFLSIITSSWLPVILAVDGGFPVHAAPSPPWKVALLSFSRSYGLATDWIGDMATGICNDVLGSASRGTWRKTARRVWSAYFFFSANVVEVPSAVSRELSKTAFSAVAHYMSRTSAVETNRSVVSRSPHICFSWFRWEFLNRSSVFPVTAAYVGRGLFSVGFVDTGGQNPFNFVLNDLF